MFTLQLNGSYELYPSLPGPVENMSSIAFRCRRAHAQTRKLQSLGMCHGIGLRRIRETIRYRLKPLFPRIGRRRLALLHEVGSYRGIRKLRNSDVLLS